MTETIQQPISLDKCRRFVFKADHGDGCVFLSNIAPCLCTCGLQDLKRLVTGMQSGNGVSISASEAVKTNVARCPMCGMGQAADKTKCHKCGWERT